MDAQVLERHLPALADLLQRGVFTQGELKLVVAKRRRYELLLQKHIPQKVDYLQYLAYEMSLEKLRKLRSKRRRREETAATGKPGKAGPGDHYGKRHIFFIFERLTKRFGHDLAVWLQYLEYASRERSRKALGKLYAKALQRLPGAATLWIRAASHEFFEMNNAVGARALMQRALRINPHLQDLWTAYFKLELEYVDKLTQRRSVLGIAGEAGAAAAGSDAEGGSEDEDADADGDADGSGDEGSDGGAAAADADAAPESDAATARFYAGAVPARVYEEAVAAFPEALGFAEKFAGIARPYKDGPMAGVYAAVLADTAKRFPDGAAGAAGAGAAGAAAEDAVAALGLNYALGGVAGARAAMSAREAKQAAGGGEDDVSRAREARRLLVAVGSL